MRSESWGRFPLARQRDLTQYWGHHDLPKESASLLPRGMGRSYGDVCLNHGGDLLHTRPLNRFMAFDVETGLLRCEAGTTLEAILSWIVPKGWFLPVVPGTQFVSLGGAIANDIHGKNHHRAGSFGAHVTAFELLRSKGKRMICKPDKNREWYRATIGGLGLTGLITWAEIKLMPIHNPWICAEFIPFYSLEQFGEISMESDRSFEYSVAWVDTTVSRGHRGIFIRGNHAPANTPGIPREKRVVSVPFDAPSMLLNGLSMRVFNRLYFALQRMGKSTRLVDYRSFFFPLDGVAHWNRFYGKRGFYQHQSVVPDLAAVADLLERLKASGMVSFLTVLKQFGSRSSDGLLSFPRPGYTLALDLPIRKKSNQVMAQLENCVVDRGGAIYPAKDAVMEAKHFQAFFPKWPDLESLRDPVFSSSFWRRVTP